MKEGFVPVDIEEDPVGAKLHFGGVWLKSNEEFTTEKKFGMDELMFSNFCGEMTDHYYRQINFEAYEIGRMKICYAGSWTTGNNASKQRRRKRTVSETFFDVPVDLDWDRFLP